MYSGRMELVIFHYHLLPGGVTTVIRQGVQSLRAHSRRVSRIRVVAGRVPSGFPIGRDAEVLCAPDIDYLSPPLLSRMLWKKRVERLTGMLMERFGGRNAVWWVHNYHLGKNPVFTDAVLKVAGMPDGPRLILQPHDFPEAGRSTNLRLLDRFVSRPLYPVGPRVRYALINRRDMDLLRKAGVPADLVFLLENPVSPPGRLAHAEDKPTLRSRL
ncbi:MAG TPA: glycosyltransferase family 1 protein, partial [Spirochaetia bacterium]|nr:glycosyltransferase family 1 protein [Spirochaetia bacterium]